MVLQVQWASLEAHRWAFASRPAFAQWREVIGPFFQSPPNVEHFDDVRGSVSWPVNRRCGSSGSHDFRLGINEKALPVHTGRLY